MRIDDRGSLGYSRTASCVSCLPAPLSLRFAHPSADVRFRCCIYKVKYPFHSILPNLIQSSCKSYANNSSDASHIRLFPLMQSIEQWDRIARSKLYDGHQLGTLLDRSERLLALKGLADEEQHIVLLKLLHLIDCFEDDMTNRRKKLSTEAFVSIVDNLPPMRHYSVVLETVCDLLHTIPPSSFER